MHVLAMEADEVSVRDELDDSGMIKSEAIIACILELLCYSYSNFRTSSFSLSGLKMRIEFMRVLLSLLCTIGFNKAID